MALTSSMVVDTTSLNMLDSSSWNEVIDALSSMYLSVYETGNPARPQWLYQREELSHFALSLSSNPLSTAEITVIASKLASEHGGFNSECKVWALGEAKWLVQYLQKAPTLMGGFMALPTELKESPGDNAPTGHTMEGRPMRVAMVHSAFVILAASRRVAPIEQVRDQTLGADDDMKGFTVHADGSISKEKVQCDKEDGGVKALETLTSAAQSPVNAELQAGAAVDPSWSAVAKNK
mmetsp:Transcript_44472/g.87518  ORF Transcript_44472/g.87518 Transcript_44472/m.87518 type:complete len:236 (-) Transcript_44472:114-821(-)